MSAASGEGVLQVGLIQADLVWQDANANRRRLAAMMDDQPHCDLYVIPETFSTGFLGDEGLEAETMDGPSVAWMRDQARARQAAVAGSLVIADSHGRRFNRLVFMPPDGEPTCYDKRHRFGYGGESDRYTAGERQAVVEWRGWRIDLQVCYDLRFPVWCRNDRGYDIQLYVANWPAPRAGHWSRLLTARAIENQAYVIGVNRVGRDGNDVDYAGGSGVWGPGGDEMLRLGDVESSAHIRIDREALKTFRATLPFLEDADPFRLGNG
jgi:predicted amidohydrolase